MSLSFITGMKIDPDGGYKDLVIRISSDGSVPENDCPKILYNLKVRLISNIVFSFKILKTITRMKLWIIQITPAYKQYTT